MPRQLLIPMAVLGALLAPAAVYAQDEFEADLLHAIPGITVDVRGNGSELLSGFEEGTTADLTPLAGQDLDVELFDSDSGDALTPDPIGVTVPTTGSWTVVAHLDTDDEPAITAFENDRTETAAGEGRIVLRHAAAAPAVDLIDGDGDLVAGGVGNAIEASFGVAAGVVDDFQLVLPDDTTVDFPVVEPAAGEEITVYAVGSVAAETFDFLVTAAVEVGAESGPATTVDSTPVPGRVDTGEPISTGWFDDPLLVAAGLIVLSGGFLLLRWRLRPR